MSPRSNKAIQEWKKHLDGNLICFLGSALNAKCCIAIFCTILCYCSHLEMLHFHQNSVDEKLKKQIILVKLRTFINTSQRVKSAMGKECCRNCNNLAHTMILLLISSPHAGRYPRILERKKIK